jgi:hypothetical protein
MDFIKAFQEKLNEARKAIVSAPLKEAEQTTIDELNALGGWVLGRMQDGDGGDDNKPDPTEDSVLKFTKTAKVDSVEVFSMEPNNQEKIFFDNAHTMGDLWDVTTGDTVEAVDWREKYDRADFNDDTWRALINDEIKIVRKQGGANNRYEDVFIWKDFKGYWQYANSGQFWSNTQ